MQPSFSTDNFHDLCDQLARADPDLASVITTHGYPPLWTRANTYETLVHIILEQQVSLASAKAALEKLRTRVVTITPETVVLLSDEELKTAYVSRQKASYTKLLAQEIIDARLDLVALQGLPDESVREQLTRLKGIGNWTVDIYLIMVLHRPDVFPIGDLAVVNAFRRLKQLPRETPRETIIDLASQWQPYRSIATMILWHYYLSTRQTV